MNIDVRPLRAEEIDEADRIFRLAFGTFLGLPDPVGMFPDTQLVRTRFQTDPGAFHAASVDGALAGSNFATHWGSFGFFGPLTVRPDLWDRRIGSRLMEPIMEAFGAWRCRHTGLFTFAQSAKHHGLYQKFGFWPRFLTPVLEKPAASAEAPPARWTSYVATRPDERAPILAEMRAITDAIYPGLDVTTAEVEPLARHDWGDVVMVDDGNRLTGFAVCHCGTGTEAASGMCYVKFGAVRPGPRAHEHFRTLLAGCEDLARRRHLRAVSAGVNMGRSTAYRTMLDAGYRAGRLVGVAMQQGNEEGYNRPEVMVIDDWR